MKSVVMMRSPAPRMNGCELTYVDRDPIDGAAALAEHRLYADAVQAAGASVMYVAAEPEMADAVFVEDPAIVLDELAIITRPGALSRQQETSSVAAALEPLRALRHIEAPATLEGGDVMRIGRTLYVGLSTRSNEAGVQALRAIVQPYGYQVVAVQVTGALHLKTACTYLADPSSEGGVILCNPAWFDVSPLADFRMIEVHPDEPFAGNAMWVNGVLFMPSACSATKTAVTRQVGPVRTIRIDELIKAEAGLTCMSLRFEV